MAIYIDSIVVTADASVEPVSRTQAKEWMRISYNTDDTLIDELITSSRKHLRN